MFKAQHNHKTRRKSSDAHLFSFLLDVRSHGAFLTRLNTPASPEFSMLIQFIIGEAKVQRGPLTSIFWFKNFYLMAKTSASMRERGGTLMGLGGGKRLGESRDKTTWSKKSPVRLCSDWPKAIAVQGPDKFPSSTIEHFRTTFSGWQEYDQGVHIHQTVLEHLPLQPDRSRSHRNKLPAKGEQFISFLFPMIQYNTGSEVIAIYRELRQLLFIIAPQNPGSIRK